MQQQSVILFIRVTLTFILFGQRYVEIVTYTYIIIYVYIYIYIYILIDMQLHVQHTFLLPIDAHNTYYD